MAFESDPDDDTENEMDEIEEFNITVEIVFFAPLNVLEKRQKMPIRKNPVFDNKLHNEVVTYSKSTIMRPACITNIIYGIHNT